MPPSGSPRSGLPGPHGFRRAAIALTAAAMLGLVVLKAVIRPAWRASARTRLGTCVPEPGGRPAERLRAMGHLASCAGRVEPLRTDYLEWTVAAMLVVLLVVELRLILRDRARGMAGADH